MRFLGWLLLLGLVVGAVGYWVIHAPYGPQTETFVDITPGTGTEGIAAKLEAAGVIRSRYGFDLLRVVKGGTLKAGEYRFDHPEPMTDVYAKMARGEVYTVLLTIPEGYNIFDIAQAVEAAGLGRADAFLTQERAQTELIREWSPKAESLEGYLFPDSYRFSRHATPTLMLMTMVKRFRQASLQLGLEGDDVARTVTMASLVEKEVREDSERPLVAGVFENRLAQKMPLGTDPTVIYAALLEKRWQGTGAKRTIYASDLQSASAYNTYKHAGLPPGPICSPGMASLKAAMHPAKTDYLYFVSDAAGHSRFSVGLKEHAGQVEAYRRAEGRR